MPLTNLEPTDLFDAVETKLDATIDKVNQIDLNIDGGTTGQVLKKSSNTDYDYTWAAEQDVSGKADKTQLLIANSYGAGPTAFSTETTMLTLTPSASQSAAKMKYTFCGYADQIDPGDTFLVVIKKNGAEIGRTYGPGGAVGQAIGFCLVCVDSYTANQPIIATMTLASGGRCIGYSLICESLNAV
jgi:hypothetical protein